MKLSNRRFPWLALLPAVACWVGLAVPFTTFSHAFAQDPPRPDQKPTLPPIPPTTPDAKDTENEKEQARVRELRATRDIAEELERKTRLLQERERERERERKQERDRAVEENPLREGSDFFRHEQNPNRQALRTEMQRRVILEMEYDLKKGEYEIIKKYIEEIQNDILIRDARNSLITTDRAKDKKDKEDKPDPAALHLERYKNQLRETALGMMELRLQMQTLGRGDANLAEERGIRHAQLRGERDERDEHIERLENRNRELQNALERARIQAERAERVAEEQERRFQKAAKELDVLNDRLRRTEMESRKQWEIQEAVIRERMHAGSGLTDPKLVERLERLEGAVKSFLQNAQREKETPASVPPPATAPIPKAPL